MAKPVQSSLKIYTKTGDKGLTSLFGGKRVQKFSLRVEGYGTVDELNSAIGVVVAELGSKNKELGRELSQIQNDLLDIGSALATPKMKKIELEKRIKEFESSIDEMSLKLPELRNFILPGPYKLFPKTRPWIL